MTMLGRIRKVGLGVAALAGAAVGGAAVAGAATSHSTAAATPSAASGKPPVRIQEHARAGHRRARGS